MIEKVGEARESIARLAKKTKENAKRIVAVGLAAGGIALVGAGCGTGDEGIRTKKEAVEFATKDYELTWKKAKTPVERYILQYVAPARIDILDENTADADTDGRNLYHSFVFGNGCLQNTSYDIAGGHIRGWGRSVVRGRVPAASAEAYVDNKNPDMLTIQSGNNQSHDLHFTGAQGQTGYLEPADQQTENVVELTNGCVTAGEFEYQHVYLQRGETSGFIVRTDGDFARPEPGPNR